MIWEGDGEVGKNSTMAPSTRSTLQSHRVIKAHFTGEETEAQRACADHLRSQNKSMERQDWGPGIPV